MDVFFFERRHLEMPVEINGRQFRLPTSTMRTVLEMGMREAMPFALNADRTYAAPLNRILRRLPTESCPSPNTWRAYAQDGAIFARFQHQVRKGKSIFDADRDDINEFKRVRVESEFGSVSASTWNRGVAALEKLFALAEEEGLMKASPFTYSNVRVRPGQGWKGNGRRNNATEKNGGNRAIRCLSRAEYLLFRNVGLLGQTPDGSFDPSFRGRNGLRDAGFSDFCVTTGARCEEGGSVLLGELPNIDSAKWKGFDACKLRLAKKITKGDKGRTVWIPIRVLRDFITPYRREGRASAAEKARRHGRYERVEDPLPVRTWDERSCIVARVGAKDIRVDYDSLDPAIRQRLLDGSGTGGDISPGLLWLTEAGMPIQPATWGAVCRRACERMRRRFDIDLDVTPHVLRHTFAVRMLSNLIRRTFKSVVGLGDHRRRLGDEAYDRIVADPLRILRDLMGHSSQETTALYLKYIEEAEELVHDAIASWDDEIAAGVPEGWPENV